MAKDKNNQPQKQEEPKPPAPPEQKTAQNASAAMPVDRQGPTKLADQVPAEDRMGILDDLLAQLQPYTAETGANETASDVLKRIINDWEALEIRNHQNAEAHQRFQAELTKMADDNRRLRDAMVARRAPDAQAGAALEAIRATVGAHLPDGKPPAPHEVSGKVTELLAEKKKLEEFFSEKPMTALGVRDDSTPELKERYSVLLVEWDGRKSSTSVLEEKKPWGDLKALTQSTLDQRVVPAPFR